MGSICLVSHDLHNIAILIEVSLWVILRGNITVFVNGHEIV